MIAPAASADAFQRPRSLTVDVAFPKSSTFRLRALLRPDGPEDQLPVLDRRHLLQHLPIDDFQLELPGSRCRVEVEGFDAFLVFHAPVDARDDAEDLTSILAQHGLELGRSMRPAVQERSRHVMLEVVLQVGAEDDASLLGSSDNSNLTEMSLDRGQAVVDGVKSRDEGILPRPLPALSFRLPPGLSTPQLERLPLPSGCNRDLRWRKCRGLRIGPWGASAANAKDSKMRRFWLSPAS
jgi:hypothetical protein